MAKTQNGLVFRVSHYGDDLRPAIFLFCPFGVPAWQLNLRGLPIWRFRRAGYQVIAYSYRASVLTVSAELTMQNFNAIMDDALNRLNNLTKDVPVYAFGSSMGTVLAMNFASRSPRVTKIVLNLSYFNIAEHILHLPPLPRLSAGRLSSYVADAGGPDGLHHTFDLYSPDHLAGDMDDRDILLYLSRNDRVLQYRHTRKLRAKLVEAGARVKYVETAGLGHYFAALSNHLRASTYMEFLNG